MTEILKKGKAWQYLLENCCKRLIIANNQAALCEEMEQSYTVFLKIADNCNKHKKRKKATKIILLLKKYLFLCNLSKEKFEISSDYQDKYSSMLSRYLSILIEVSFTTSSLEDLQRCRNMTTFLELHLKNFPERLVDSVLRVVNVFKRRSESWSPLYWKVWQLAEKNLNNSLYLKCLLLAKHWTRHLKMSEREPYIKSVLALPVDSLSRKWINKQLKLVGVLKIVKKKKMTKLIFDSLKVKVRKSLKKLFYGKVSKDDVQPAKSSEAAADIPIEKVEETEGCMWFEDRKGDLNVETEGANENDSDLNTENFFDKENACKIKESASGLDQANHEDPSDASVDDNLSLNVETEGANENDSDVNNENFSDKENVCKIKESVSGLDKANNEDSSDANVDDNLSFKSVETDYVSDDEVDKINTSKDGQDISNGIVICHANEKSSLVEDNETDEKANLEISKNAGSPFSLKIDVSDPESEGSDKFEFGKRKKKSSAYKIRGDSRKNSVFDINDKSDDENGDPKTVEKRLSKQTVEMLEVSDSNDESGGSKTESKFLNENGVETKSEKVDDSDSSSADEVCKKLDFVEESVSEMSDDENDFSGVIESKNKKNITNVDQLETNAEESEDEPVTLPNSNISSPSVLVERVSKNLLDEANASCTPKKVLSPERESQGSIVRSPSSLMLGSLTRKSLRSHNSLLSQESNASKLAIEGILSQTNKDFLQLSDISSPQKSIAALLKNIPSFLECETPSHQKGNSLPLNCDTSSQNSKTPSQKTVLSPLKTRKSKGILSPQKHFPLADKTRTSSFQKSFSSPNKSGTASPQKNESPAKRKKSSLDMRSETSSSSRTPSPQKDFPLADESGTPLLHKSLSSPNKSRTASPQKNESPAKRKRSSSDQKSETSSTQKTFSLLIKSGTPSPQKDFPLADESETTLLHKNLLSPNKSRTASPQKNESPAKRKTPSSDQKSKTSSTQKTFSFLNKSVTPSPQKDFPLADESGTSPLHKSFSLPNKSGTPSPQKTESSASRRLFSNQKSGTPSPQRSFVSPNKSITSSPHKSRSSLKRLSSETSSSKDNVDDLVLQSETESEVSSAKVARRISKRVATPVSSIRLRSRVGKSNISRIEEVDESSNHSFNSVTSSQSQKITTGRREIVGQTPRTTPTRVKSTPTTASRLRSRRASALSEIEEEKVNEPQTSRSKRMKVATPSTEVKQRGERSQSVSPANVRYSQRLRGRDVKTVAVSRIKPTSVDTGSADSKPRKSGPVDRFDRDRHDPGNVSSESCSYESSESHNSNDVASGSLINSPFTAQDFENYQTIKTLPCTALETPKRRSPGFVLGSESKTISPKIGERDSKFLKSLPRSCKTVYGLRPKK